MQSIFQQYNNDVQFSAFFFSLFLSIVLSSVLRLLYDKINHDPTNTFVLSKSFVLITISTFFVVFIVKSSITLSLGLVGALSIIRFRTPIKDPLELAMIFVCIAIGISLAVHQFFLSFVFSIVCIAYLIVVLVRSEYFLPFKEKEDSKLANSLFKYLKINNKEVYYIQIESNTDLSITELNNFLGETEENAKIYSSSLTKDKNYFSLVLFSSKAVNVYDFMEKLKLQFTEINIYLKSSAV